MRDETSGRRTQTGHRPKTVFIAEKDGDPLPSAALPDMNQPLLRASQPGCPEWWTMAKMLYW
jgi:hypothetical protein